MPVGNIQKSPPFFPTYKKEQRAAPERSGRNDTRSDQAGEAWSIFAVTVSRGVTLDVAFLY
jgi:hypothetical protein